MRGPLPSARLPGGLSGAAPGAPGAPVPAGSAAGSLTPAALRMACAKRFKASRVWSDMRLVEACCALSPAAAPAAPSVRRAARRCCSATCTGCGCRPRDRGDVHVGVDDGHEGMPHRARIVAAGGAARHVGVVVVAEPDDADVLAGEADEPNVLGPGARSRLAGDIGKVELRRPAGALGHHLVEHPVHLLGHLAADHLRRRRLVAVPGVDEVALRAHEVEDGVGLGELAAVGECGDATRVLDRRYQCRPGRPAPCMEQVFLIRRRRRGAASSRSPCRAPPQIKLGGDRVERAREPLHRAA